MHPHQAAFLEYRVATSLISDLPVSAQVPRLKWELLHALERACDAVSRSHCLELELDRLKSSAIARTREHQAFSAQLHGELTDRTRQLAELRAESDAKLGAAYRDLAAVNAKCEALDELCKSLLLIADQAADASDEFQNPKDDLRASA